MTDNGHSLGGDKAKSLGIDGMIDSNSRKTDLRFLSQSIPENHAFRNSFAEFDIDFPELTVWCARFEECPLTALIHRFDCDLEETDEWP